MAPSWAWRYQDAEGAEIEGGLPRDGFGTQGDAESWIGEAWRDLLAAGVHQVTLLEDQRVVYGPMSLHPGPDG